MDLLEFTGSYRSESPDSRSGPRTHPLELDASIHEEFQPLLSRIDGQSLDTYGDADSQPRRDVRTTQRTSLVEPSSRRESHLRYDFSIEPSPLFGLRSTNLQEGMTPPGRSTPYPDGICQCCCFLVKLLTICQMFCLSSKTLNPSYPDLTTLWRTTLEPGRA